MRGLHEDELVVYAGSYAPAASESVYVYRFNKQTGSLTLQQSLSGLENPSFLTLNGKQNRLYAVSEAVASDGKVASYQINEQDGSLSFLNGQSSLGRSTCYVTLDNGATCMICANYTSGDVVIYPVDSEGRIGEATHRVQHSGGSIRSDRQEGPHPHAAVIAPGGRFVFIPDLGLDQIKSYEIDYRNYRLLPHRDVQVQPGAGPRHMVFHSTIHFAYVINELDNTISAFAYAEPDGTLNPVQTVPALPGNFTGSSTCADIHISPSGSFLYGSNRGHDSIVVYKINKSDGTLTYVEHVSTLGRTPRNFALTPDGRFLLAANQDSDSIVTFHIDPQTGRLQAAGQSVSVAKPVCIKIMK